MRGLYLKLALWSLVTLLFCVFAFSVTTTVVARNMTRRGDMYGRLMSWQMAQAVKAYETGGKVGLKSYMAEVQQYFTADHYLLDVNNRDLLTGEDHSDLVQQVSNPPRFFVPFFAMGPTGRMVFVRQSDDEKFRFVVKLEPPVNASTTFPFFGIILLAIAGFSYALFRYLVSPVRQLSTAVERFGQGDFTARVSVKRTDELGLLAARFNAMAERIQTLLAAERRLLEDVSHELRSPLARMQFALELVRSAPDRGPAVDRMRREIDRLSSLVGQLVEVTRAEGDPDARVKETINLSELAEEIVSDCRIEADARGCAIQLVADEEVYLIADRELIRRALENVLRNGIRYSPERSTIELHLSKQAQAAAIQVRDFGPGVPEEMLERIFQPFFRVDSSRDTSTGGIGLGLAIARRAVTLHHGLLKAENAKPGLRVSIELPLAA